MIYDISRPNRAQRRFAARSLKRGRPEGEDDLAFFARFPERSYRARPASRKEIAKRVAAYGYPPTTPDGFHYNILVHKFSPDHLDHLFVVGSADPDIELAEDRVQSLWETFACRHLICLKVDMAGDPRGSLATRLREEVAAVSIEHFVSAIGWPPPVAVVAKDDACHVVWRYADLQCPHSEWDRKAEELSRLAFVLGLPVEDPVSNMVPFDLDSLLAEAAS